MNTVESRESVAQKITRSEGSATRRAHARQACALGAFMVALSGLTLASCTQDAASEPDQVDNSSAAATSSLTWKGLTWNLTNGGMAGIAAGNSNNIFVDGNGYLHLKIVNTGGTWTASEMFTTTNLGFGTYQWQVEGPVDRMDPSVVLGLFPYGPRRASAATGPTSSIRSSPSGAIPMARTSVGRSTRPRARRSERTTSSSRSMAGTR